MKLQDKYPNAKAYLRAVDSCASEAIGRDRKKGFKKGHLVSECEAQIIKVWDDTDPIFLKTWIKSYLYYYKAMIYGQVYPTYKDTWASERHSYMFIGLYSMQILEII